jgi:hypothetical protein
MAFLQNLYFNIPYAPLESANHDSGDLITATPS